MMKAERKTGPRFSELPLVFFTTLAIASAGLGAGRLTVWVLGWMSGVPSVSLMALIVGGLGVGFLFSVGHLGRPLRGPMALFGLGRSPLSNEVLVVGMAMGSGLVFVLLPAGAALGPVAAWATLVACVLTLLALGFVYRLPGQLTWTGPAPFHPLILGLALGLSFLLTSLPDGTQARAELAILVVLTADGLLVWDRSWRISNSLQRGAPTHPNFMAWRIPLLLVRIALGILLPASALLMGHAEVASLSLFLNILLDRFLFYGLGVMENTEGEIGKVENLLRISER